MNISKILNIILALTLLILIVKTSFLEKEKTTNSSDGVKVDAIENIMNRKSVRAYQNKVVEDDKIDLMLKAAMAAPSGKNNQPCEFFVVKNKEILNKMGEGLANARMLSDVNQAIIICGDTTKSIYWHVDCAAATQNLLLAVESMGLGAVWTAAYPYNDRISVINGIIDFPEHVVPLNVIPFGYPAAPQEPKDKFDANKIHYIK